jgi:hypothetical protein
MSTKNKKPTKPASKDPVKEAKSHPDGPGLTEMINGQEEKKPRGAAHPKTITNPDIPII